MKRFKKVLALMMAVIMVIGAANLPAKEVNAAGNVTLEVLDSSGIQSGANKMLVHLGGFSTEQLNAVSGTVNPTIKVDGKDSTSIAFARAGSDGYLTMHIWDAYVGEGSTSSPSQWGTHVITIPEGTVIFGNTVTQDLTFTLRKGSVLKYDFNKVTLEALSGQQDGSAYKMLIRIGGFTTEQMSTISGTLSPNPTILIDGVSKSVTAFNRAGASDGYITMHLWNAHVGEGEKAPSAWANHVITIPKGTVLYNYTVTEDLTFTVYKGTVLPYDFNKVELTVLDSSHMDTANNGKYLVHFGGFHTEQLAAVSGVTNPTIQIDGKTSSSSACNRAGASDAYISMHLWDAHVSDGSVANSWKPHVITVPAGTKFYSFTTSNELTFTILKGKVYAGDLTKVGLQISGGGQDGSSNKMLVRLGGFTTEQLNTISGNINPSILVDGVASSSITFGGATASSGYLTMHIWDQYVGEGATASPSEWKNHVITIPAGTMLYNFKVEQDFTFTLFKGSVVAGEMDKNVTLGLGTDNIAQNGADLKRYLIYLNGATDEQKTGMHREQATIWVDGVQKTGASQYYRLEDGSLVLLLKYADLEDGGGSKNAADLQGHTVQIKAGTTVGGFYNIANDLTFYVNQETIGEGELPSIVLEPGEILIENPENKPTVITTVKQSLEAGSTITFDVNLTESRNFAVWLLGDGDEQYFAKGYTNTDTASVTVPIPKDTNIYKIQVQYRDASHAADTTTDKTGIKTIIKNLKVHNGNVAVGRDGSVTMTNPNSSARVDYICDMRIPTGGTVTFDTEVTGPASDYAVWIFDLDGNELKATGATNYAKKSVSFTSDTAHRGFRLHVQFRNVGTAANYSGTDLYDCAIKISNLKVSVPSGDKGVYGNNVTTLNEGGMVQMIKTTDNANMIYNICNDVKSGSTISFDMDMNLNEAGAVFVIGGNTEFLAKGYDRWTGKTTYTATITKDVTNPYIQVQFRGDSKANTGHVVTLTNLQVTPAETIYTQQAIKGIHAASTMYDATTKSWQITLGLSAELADFNTDTYYHSLMLDVDGRVRYVRAKTVPSEAGDTGTLLRFTLSEADFPNGILENSVVTVYADKATGYTIHSGGLHYQKNAAGIELTSQTKLYLNEIGVGLGGYLTKTTKNVTPTLTGYSTSELYLAFEAEVPVGAKLTAQGTKDGIYLNGSKLSGAYLTCTAAGDYTLSLGQNAQDGDDVVIMGIFVTEDGNYKVSFVTTQFTYASASNSWEITEYIPLGSTGVFGDANAQDGFNSADLVRYIRFIQEKTQEINAVDGDLNGSGFVDEADKTLCRALLLGAVSFADGSNITPGAPTYEGAESLSIGAYYGPRRIGPNYYNGSMENDATKTTDYRTNAEFAKYVAAGFNFVVADNDGNYDYNWTSTGPVASTGFATSDLKAYMQAAASANVDVIVSSSTLNGMLRGEQSVNTDTIANMLTDLKTMNNFKGLMMADEPNSGYLTNYQQIAAVNREQAPKAQMFTSLLPTYGSESDYQSYLANYSKALGFLNYDFYPFKQTEWFWDQNPMNADWFKNLELAATTGRSNCDTGVTIQSMAHEPTNGASGMAYRTVDKADISFQVYSALAYGNKTLTYYTYWSHPRQTDAHTYTQSMVDYPTSGTESKTNQLYYDVQAVNAEIKKFENVLMDFTWQGTIAISKNDSDDLLADLDGTFASSRIKAKSASRDAIIGCLRDSKGYDGFMLVNATNPADNRSTEVSVTFNNADRAIVYVNGVKDDVALTDGKYTATLAAGEGVFVIPYIAN